MSEGSEVYFSELSQLISDFNEESIRRGNPSIIINDSQGSTLKTNNWNNYISSIKGMINSTTYYKDCDVQTHVDYKRPCSTDNYYKLADMGSVSRGDKIDDFQMYAASTPIEYYSSFEECSPYVRRTTNTSYCRCQRQCSCYGSICNCNAHCSECNCVGYHCSDCGDSCSGCDGYGECSCDSYSCGCDNDSCVCVSQSCDCQGSGAR